MREPMRNVDKAWLDMDTPTNLMIINGVMLFDAPIDYTRFCTVLEERLVRPFRRFRQRIVNRPGPGGLAWELDTHFDLRSHVRHIALPGKGDIPSLQAFVSDRLSEAFEPSRPLWRFYLIDNVEGGCAVFGRLHHCIADGIALVQVLLSLTDEEPDAPARPAALSPQTMAALQPNAFATPVEPSVQEAPASFQPKRGLLPGSPFALLRGAAHGTTQLIKVASARSLHQAVQTAVNPHHLLEATYTAGLMSVTGAAILAKLLVLPPDNDSLFKGALGMRKRVVWSEPVALDKVRTIARSAGATINDILVAATAGALRRYMEAHGGAVDMRAMVPVNLRDPAKPLSNLGNEFALVYLNLPLQEPIAARRLREIKRQMDMLKQSPEPLLIYEILNVIGTFPGEMAEWATTWFSTKASAVLTNVPGPRTQLYFCGQPMQRIMFWVPQSGRIGLGISIISYCGDVSLGVMVDEGLVEEPGAILTAFAEELAALRVSGASDGMAGKGMAGKSKRTETVISGAALHSGAES
jgi:WS/DGAT/MGAT family acyltransferase